MSASSEQRATLPDRRAKRSRRSRMNATTHATHGSRTQSRADSTPDPTRHPTRHTPSSARTVLTAFVTRVPGRRPIVTRFAIIVGVVGILGAGTSVAYWSPVGSGAGNAEVADVRPVTAESVAIPSGMLSPGSAPVDVTITLQNPNNFPVTVTALSAAFTSDTPGCGDDATHPTGLTFDFSQAVLPTFTGSASLIAKASMDMTSVAACQGATFNTVLTVGVRR